MSTLVGTKIGSFAVTAVLGAGGMGEVYRARDVKLGRDVALKILPSATLDDPERRARFDREARLLAALNHPNVAAIYGVEESAGRQLLVLELVEGQTLAERLAKRSMGIPEAMRVASQIAAALAAAHERGIVHRDLKPGNVAVTADGIAKVLDFGIAKMSSSPLDANVPEAATHTTMTRAGVIVGTAAYMSPEQARGLTVDRRTDVWAFGCVLYEMLAGTAAFDGTTGTDVLAAILEREPDWTRLPATMPASIRRLLHKCLKKDPAERLRDMGDIRILIEDAINEPPSAAAVVPFQHRVWWAAAFVASALAGAPLAWLVWSRSSTPTQPVRVSLTAPGPVSPQLSGAISPDGHHVAFVATGPSGKAMLWIRSLDSLDARELPGTERAAHPFWSPDSRSIGFTANAKLHTVSLAGGPVQTLADSPLRGGASWNRDGVILFNPQFGQIAAVPAAGGAVTPVVSADPAHQPSWMAWPDFLPDGRHFLYFDRGRAPELRGVYVGSLDAHETKFLLRTDVQAKYAAPGYLLFMRDETLMAQRFDQSRFELSGVPVPVADGVWFARGAAHAAFSASGNESLVYVNASAWKSQLAWIDRSGRLLGPLAGPDRYATITPQLSPDATKVAIGRGEFRRGDVWILDVTSGTPSRVTFGPEGHGVPVWSADGRRLMFQTGTRIIVRDVERGSDETLFDAARTDSVADWSSDGAFVVLSRSDHDIWVLPLAGDRRPFPFLETPANKTQAQLAPDGKWIAYTSNETGRDEVYVQSFPESGRKRQISTDGGAMPRWRRDGELFFLAANQFMTAVTITKSGGSVVFGSPVPLFHTKLIVQGSEATGLPTSYDVTADGKRFLLNGAPEDAGPPMTVVLNWTGAIRK
jgi:Tol biopolymer transport system component